jgi:hypothetical protein
VLTTVICNCVGAAENNIAAPTFTTFEEVLYLKVSSNLSSCRLHDMERFQKRDKKSLKTPDLTNRGFETALISHQSCYDFYLFLYCNHFNKTPLTVCIYVVIGHLLTKLQLKRIMFTTIILQRKRDMFTCFKGCLMDKVVSIRLPEDVALWLSDASRLINKTVSGLSRDIILIAYSSLKKEVSADFLSLSKEVDKLRLENSFLRNELKVMKGLKDGTVSRTVEEYQVKKEAAVLNNNNPYQGTGRNAPCPCGSGKKYKHCCGS